MRVKVRIPSEVRCKGRILAEGKKAYPSFCWRERTLKKDPLGRKTAIELHSRITGKVIGYVGREGELVSKVKAVRWSPREARRIPEMMKDFILSAQRKKSAYHNNLVIVNFHRLSRKLMANILKAARGS